MKLTGLKNYISGLFLGLLLIGSQACGMDTALSVVKSSRQLIERFDARLERAFDKYEKKLQLMAWAAVLMLAFVRRHDLARDAVKIVNIVPDHVGIAFREAAENNNMKRLQWLSKGPLKKFVSKYALEWVFIDALMWANIPLIKQLLLLNPELRFTRLSFFSGQKGLAPIELTQSFIGEVEKFRTIEQLLALPSVEERLVKVKSLKNVTLSEDELSTERLSTIRASFLNHYGQDLSTERVRAWRQVLALLAEPREVAAKALSRVLTAPCKEQPKGPTPLPKDIADKIGALVTGVEVRNEKEGMVKNLVKMVSFPG